MGIHQVELQFKNIYIKKKMLGAPPLLFHSDQTVCLGSVEKGLQSSAHNR